MKFMFAGFDKNASSELISKEMLYGQIDMVQRFDCSPSYAKKENHTLGSSEIMILPGLDLGPMSSD